MSCAALYDAEMPLDTTPTVRLQANNLGHFIGSRSRLNGLHPILRHLKPILMAFEAKLPTSVISMTSKQRLSFLMTRRMLDGTVTFMT